MTPGWMVEGQALQRLEVVTDRNSRLLVLFHNLLNSYIFSTQNSIRNQLFRIRYLSSRLKFQVLCHPYHSKKIDGHREKPSSISTSIQHLERLGERQIQYSLRSKKNTTSLSEESNNLKFDQIYIKNINIYVSKLISTKIYYITNLIMILIL